MLGLLHNSFDLLCAIKNYLTKAYTKTVGKEVREKLGKYRKCQKLIKFFFAYAKICGSTYAQTAKRSDR